ncbi:MAG: NUDIX hydrolase [Pseudonocardiales bacterium]
MSNGTAYEILDSELRFTGNVISLASDTVVMPDGTSVVRDYVRHPGAVGIVALDEEGQVLLVHQYRHPVREKLWEIPAGLLDVTDEPPLAAAKRELHEEGAVTAEDWHLLLDTYNSPGSSNEAIRVFLARRLHPVADAQRYIGEAEEAGMELRWVPLDEAVSWTMSGRILNAMCGLGVLAAARARSLDWRPLRVADYAWPPPVES